MNSTAQSHPRSAKIAETPAEIAFVRQHLQEVLAATAFRGSHRSAQFLKHIVEQSIAGNFESLKERSIGIELFGRAPSYDTGEDAIVRVTASDVRKRLLQHYGRTEPTPWPGSCFRWDLTFRSSAGIFTGRRTLPSRCRAIGARDDDCSANGRRQPSGRSGPRASPRNPAWS